MCFSRRQTKTLRLVGIVFLIVITMIGYEIYKIRSCDVTEETKYVATPYGNSMQKYNRNLTGQLYGQLIDHCIYNDKELKCSDIRHRGETVTRSLQFAVLRILHIVHLICRKHNIDYWIISGTLLGAYRDKKFIPWDNDADIALLDEDYHKFIKIARKELPARYRLIVKAEDPLNKHKVRVCAAKVRDSDTCFGNCIRHNCHWDDSLQLDIFLFHKRDDFKTSRIIYDTTGEFSFHIDDVYPTKDIEYEGVHFRGPNNVVKLLGQMFGKDFMKEPSTTCPKHGFTGIPWYSCDQIAKMPDQERINTVMVSMTHGSLFFWYFG